MTSRLSGQKTKKTGPVDKTVSETVRPHTQVRVFLRPREEDLAPFQLSCFHIQNVEFGFGCLLLAPRPRAGCCAAEELSSEKRREARRGVVRQHVGMFQQDPGPPLAVPDKQPATRIAVAGGPRHHQRLAVVMNEQLVRSMHRGRTGPVEEGVRSRILLFGCHPRFVRVPFQECAAAVTANEEPVALAAHGIPLAETLPLDPGVGLGTIAERASREERAAADRAVRRGSDAHYVRAFAGVVERHVRRSIAVGILHGQHAVDEAAFQKFATVRKMGMDVPGISLDIVLFVPFPSGVLSCALPHGVRTMSPHPGCLRARGFPLAAGHRPCH